MGSRDDEQKAFGGDGSDLVAGSGQFCMYFKGKIDIIS